MNMNNSSQAKTQKRKENNEKRQMTKEVNIIPFFICHFS
jgi:hypothetical protein